VGQHGDRDRRSGRRNARRASKTPRAGIRRRSLRPPTSVTCCRPRSTWSRWRYPRAVRGKPGIIVHIRLARKLRAGAPLPLDRAGRTRRPSAGRAAFTSPSAQQCCMRHPDAGWTRRLTTHGWGVRSGQRTTRVSGPSRTMHMAAHASAAGYVRTWRSRAGGSHRFFAEESHRFFAEEASDLTNLLDGFGVRSPART
jgi:hypothetical protein